jgi:hypothetical protein
MRNMLLGAVFCGAIMLSACANTPEPRESRFPLLTAERSGDASLSCLQVLDQLQSASALHREIGREEALFLGEDGMWAGLGILVDPISGLAGAVASGASADVRRKRYEEARTAAQRRMRVLLEVARAGSCTDPPADSLSKLDAIAAMPQAQRRDVRAKRAALLAFFDGFALTPQDAPAQSR